MFYNNLMNFRRTALFLILLAIFYKIRSMVRNSFSTLPYHNHNSVHPMDI